MFLRPFCLALATLLAAGPVLGHEFWIEAEEYQVGPNAPIRAQLRNGQNFAGMSLAWFDTRTARSELIQNGVTEVFAGRMGDVPALQLDGRPDGLLVVLHQSAPDRLTYTDWSKFRNFVMHKDFAGALERHAERGLPQTGFDEIYTRYAKALIGVGAAVGADAPSGMETEFVALANPYTDDLAGGLPVRLLYRGAPRAEAQVEVFERAPDGIVAVTYLRTDADGIARVPVRPGHRYQLDAVVLREPPADSGAAWESLWANLTFAVPPDQ